MTYAPKSEIDEKYAEYDGRHVAYVLKLRIINDGRHYYYVGMSKNFRKRLYRHTIEDLPKLFPAKDKDGWDPYIKYEQFEVIDVVDIIPCDSKNHAKIVERQRMLELAIEENTTQIIGGR